MRESRASESAAAIVLRATAFEIRAAIGRATRFHQPKQREELTPVLEFVSVAYRAEAAISTLPAFAQRMIREAVATGNYSLLFDLVTETLALDNDHPGAVGQPGGESLTDRGRTVVSESTP
jgi:hypothetical protein